MLTRIHINQHRIKSNRKARASKRLPVITVKSYKDNQYGFEVDVQGPCRIMYSPDKPLKCGAHCWIETTSKVEVK